MGSVGTALAIIKGCCLTRADSVCIGAWPYQSRSGSTARNHGGAGDLLLLYQCSRPCRGYYAQ